MSHTLDTMWYRCGCNRDDCVLHKHAGELLEAAKDIKAMIDSGLLVRDITKDGQSKWALEMMKFVMRYQKFVGAITKAEGGSE